MSTTIYDVAKTCGLSTATVSRVISGKITKNSKSYAKVMNAIEQLGYQKRHFSCETDFSGHKPKKVMLVVDDIANPFYQGIISGINSILLPTKCFVSICISNTSDSTEEDLLNYAQRDGYNGIIILTALETASLTQALHDIFIPVVLVNRSLHSVDLCSVCIDNVRGGYMAAQYLIEKGHKMIAHLSGPLLSSASNDRLKGFRYAMQDFNLPVEDKAVYNGDLKPSSGKTFAEYYIKHLKDYTAVFCANDLMASSFVHTLGEHGVKVPDDVSVICFDDTPEATRGSVKLTTVSQDPDRMGQAAAETLEDLINGRKALCTKTVFPPVLNERDSVKSI